MIVLRYIYVFQAWEPQCPVVLSHSSSVLAVQTDKNTGDVGLATFRSQFGQKKSVGTQPAHGDTPGLHAKFGTYVGANYTPNELNCVITQLLIYMEQHISR